MPGNELAALVKGAGSRLLSRTLRNGSTLVSKKGASRQIAG
jgi:hypothetical protein